MIRRRTLLSTLSAVALAPAVVRGQSMSVRMGTSIEGGGFYPFSVALVDTLKAVDPILEINPLQTKGSSENARLLQAGDIDMGLVGGEVLHEWVSANPGVPMLKVVSVIHSAPGMFCVRADSRYRRIADLRGRAVVWSPRGTGSAVQARYVMDGMGLDMDRDFEAIYPDNFVDGPFLVLGGRAAALWGSGLRWPGFVEMTTRPLGARFIAPSLAEIGRIRARYPFLASLTVPPSLYPGQYDPIPTVGAWSFILARADLEEAVGYRMAMSLYKAERTGVLTRQLAQTTARNTLVAIRSVDDLQSGVLRYYREIKLVK
jgi:TRAP transporter TAXI family solute receptor